MIDMKKITSFILGCSLIVACQSNTGPTKVAANATPAIRVDAMAVGNGWGYMIVVDGRPFIRQDYIPALAGNQVFKSKADAEKTGLWVADKMKKNERINVTTDILEQLGVK